MSAENDLTAKIGPLPAWAWGAILVGGVIVFRWWRGRTTPPNTAVAPVDPSQDPGSTVTSSDPFTSALDSFLSSDPTNPAFPVGGSGPAPITDAQWAKVAGDYLMGQGNDPSLVQQALADYTSGNSLSAGEQSIVNMALAHFGSPPEGVLAPVSSTSPVTGPPVPVQSTAPSSAVPATPAPVMPGAVSPSLISALQAKGFQVSTTPQSGVGWVGYADNLWIYAPRPAGAPDPLAAYQGDLASLVNPYLGQSYKDQAFADLQAAPAAPVVAPTVDKPTFSQAMVNSWAALLGGKV